MGSRLDLCRCYVQKLDDEARFGLRWGAHAIDCPTYRPSGDPVDRHKDDLQREHLSPKVLKARVIEEPPMRFTAPGACEECSRYCDGPTCPDCGGKVNAEY